MNAQGELEELIRIADEQIRLFDSCTVDPFPANFSESVGQAFYAIIDGQAIPPQAAKVMEQSVEIARSNACYLVRSFDRPATVIDPIIEKYFGIDLLKFFVHDRAHLSDTFAFIKDAFDCIVHGFGFSDEMRRDPDFFVNSLVDINERSERIARMYAHPWRLVKHLANKRLGNPLQYSAVNVREQLIDAAEVLSLRFSANVCYDPNPDTPLKKSISILGDDVSILADPGLIWSIAYNNLKNAQKKFEADVYKATGVGPVITSADDKKIDEYKANLVTERVSYAACYEINSDYVAIVFSDSGSALDINAMIRNMREAMQSTDKFDWVTDGMKTRFEAWRDNDYAFNDLTMEDATNVAFMARMRGSEMPSSFSSGMGLYGTRYIVEQLGGAILYTTRFEDETPVFTYLVPKKPQLSVSGARSVRNQIVRGELKVA